MPVALLDIAKEAAHATAVACVALYFFARASPAGSIWDAVSADPAEACAAVAIYYCFLSMMGNSLPAWVMMSCWAAVTNEQWDTFVTALVDRFGPIYDGWAGMALVCLGGALFVGTYTVHGLLLLPLDVRRLRALEVYKLQPGTRAPDAAVLTRVARVVIANTLLVLPVYVCAMAALTVGATYALPSAPPCSRVPPPFRPARSRARPDGCSTRAPPQPHPHAPARLRKAR